MGADRWSCRMPVTLAVCCCSSALVLINTYFSKQIWPSCLQCTKQPWSVTRPIFYALGCNKVIIRMESSGAKCLGIWSQGAYIFYVNVLDSKQLLFGELEQGHRRQGRPCKLFKDTVKAGLQWCGIPPTELVATAPDRHTYTICIICSRGRATPPSIVRQRTPLFNSLYSSDKCELPVARLRTALQVQDRPAEPLPYPQIRGTDNVILETERPP